MLNHLKNQQAKRIDFYLSLDILLGLLANMYGLKKIDWAVTYEVYHIFFALSCMFLIIDFCIIILIINFRKQNTIHTVYNLAIKYIIYFILLLNVIGMVLVIVTFINISIDLSSPVEKIENKRRYRRFLRRQWNRIFYSMSMVLVFGGLQFPLWFNSVKRVEMKTDGNIEDGGFVVIDNFE